MKCISIRQPLVEHIMRGKKQREYRSWYTHHRGPLAIHAGSSTDAMNPVERAEARKGRSPYLLGAVIGIVDVVDVVPHDGGGYAWLLANPRRLREPIPMKGRLGLFEVEIPDGAAG